MMPLQHCHLNLMGLPICSCWPHSTVLHQVSKHAASTDLPRGPRALHDNLAHHADNQDLQGQPAHEQVWLMLVALRVRTDSRTTLPPWMFRVVWSMRVGT